MNALTRPEIVARRYARFEIGDAHVRLHVVQDAKRFPPDIVGLHRLRNVAALSLRDHYIAGSILDVGFVERGITGVGQYLVDAPSRHHIAAKEQCQSVSIGGLLSTRVRHREARPNRIIR